MTLTLGLFGCGGMGQRHLLGMHQLRTHGLQRFELAGVCDLLPANAERAADVAADLLGSRPHVFESLAAMRQGLGQLDAILVTTSPDTHADIGVAALEAGIHVMVEKPITLTVPQGLPLVQAAARTQRKLAVAENYRRDPINRLGRALIEANVIGKPFLAVQSSSGGGEGVVITPWRHLKRSGGIIVDMGVHYTDILEYYLGPIRSVTGMNALIDSERIDANGNRHPADAEDLSVGVARFASGAIANWLLSIAGRGLGHFNRTFYGTSGTLAVPPDRTGRALELSLRQNGKDTSILSDELLALVPDFALDPTTAALFGGDRLSTYDLEWATIDANLLAIELDDFIESIISDRAPEVSGADGLRSLALVYGFLESEQLGRVVYIDELLRGEAAAYQNAIK